MFTIVGEGAFSRLKFESGVHRVQRAPPPPNWRAHPHQHLHRGGAAGGGVDPDVTIDPKDLRIDCTKLHRAMAASAGSTPPGPTSCACITHLAGAGGDLSERENQIKNRDKPHARAQKPPLRQAARGTDHAPATAAARSVRAPSEHPHYNLPQGRVTDQHRADAHKIDRSGVCHLTITTRCFWAERAEKLGRAGGLTRREDAGKQGVFHHGKDLAPTGGGRRLAARILREGGPVGLPTETVYGLGPTR